jgi:hypothetical protein
VGVNQDLIDILNAEFKRLEAAGGGPFPTVLRMADFLGLDQTSLSRLRSGNRFLSRGKAREIAERFRKRTNEIHDLTERLLNAQPTPTTEEVEAERWFKDRPENSLMVVEFREVPLAAPGSSKSHLAAVAARAVVAGLHYAMFYPFNVSDGTRPPSPLRSYLTDLRANVIKTYGSILDHALDLEYQRHANDKPPALRRALLNTGRRLRLYELSEPDTSACPAIGYRLFFIKDPEAGELSPTHCPPQRWEWISSPTRDHLIHKHSSAAELEATAIRFFPVVEYWDMEGALPQTSADMERVAEDLERREYYMSSFGLDRKLKWRVFEESRLESDVDSFLARVPKNKKG